MDNIFEIRDSGINVDEVMGEIQANIEKRKKDGVYTEEKIAEAEKLKLCSTPKHEDFISHFIMTAGVLCTIDVDNYRLGIPPALNRPVLGHMVLAAKEFIRRILRFHTRGVFNQQIEFNRHMVQLVEGLYNRVGELEKQIDTLKGNGKQ